MGTSVNATNYFSILTSEMARIEADRASWRQALAQTDILAKQMRGFSQINSASEEIARTMKALQLIHFASCSEFRSRLCKSQFGCAPEILTTFAHFSFSDLMYARNSSGSRQHFGSQAYDQIKAAIGADIAQDQKANLGALAEKFATHVQSLPGQSAEASAKPAALPQLPKEVDATTRAAAPAQQQMAAREAARPAAATQQGREMER